MIRNCSNFENFIFQIFPQIQGFPSEPAPNLTINLL